MPEFKVTNNSDKRKPLRTDEGVIYLNPGETRAGLSLQPSLARYYESVGHFDLAGGDGKKEAAGGGKRPLTDLSEAELRSTAETEKVDLGDLDLSNADDRATAAAIIAEFRRIYESGNTDHLRGEAGNIASVDKEALAAATTKYAIVNLIIAAKGVTAP